MGKKKSAEHVQQSMGQLVSKAALAQMGPSIEQLVRAYVKTLGGNLAVQQASTLETLFARVVVLETIVIEKLGLTTEDLTNRVADIEDEKEGLLKVESVELNDVVRLEIRTRKKDQTEFQGSSRLKISQTGTGQTIGQELESAILGMKSGETKEVEFGEDKGMVAELRLNRASRRPAPVLAPQGEVSENQSQG